MVWRTSPLERPPSFRSRGGVRQSNSTRSGSKNGCRKRTPICLSCRNALLPSTKSGCGRGPSAGPWYRTHATDLKLPWLERRDADAQRAGQDPGRARPDLRPRTASRDLQHERPVKAGAAPIRQAAAARIATRYCEQVANGLIRFDRRNVPKNSANSKTAPRRIKSAA